MPSSATPPALGAHPPQLNEPARKPALEPPTGTFPWPLPKEYTTLKTSTQLLGVLEQALGSERLREVLEGRRGVVASCGSGMTAGVIWLALQMVGVKGAPAIYDEVSRRVCLRGRAVGLIVVQSWTGYAMRPESKIEKAQ